MEPMKKINMRPRHDFVILEELTRENVNGMIMPQQSAEGKELIVLAIGPEVKDLRIGDKVECNGIDDQGRVAFALIPRTKYVMIREKQIAIVYLREGEEYDPRGELTTSSQYFDPSNYPDASEYSTPIDLNPVIKAYKGKFDDIVQEIPVHTNVNGEIITIVYSPDDLISPETMNQKLSEVCMLKWGPGELKMNPSRVSEETSYTWVRV